MTYLGVPRRGRRRGDAITAGILLVLGLFASALSREQQNQIEAVVRGTVLYPFLELHRASAERAQVGRRAAALQAERDSLLRALSRSRTLASQAEALREAAGFDTLQSGDVRSAEVYPGRPRVGDPDVFVLRGPHLRGLTFPAGVFTGLGLVGVARGPHGRGVRGEFWSHTDFRVSARTEDGRISGIVRPARLQGEQPVLLLDGAPFQEDIAAGTVLVTTGIAGVYPPGIRVGTVRELADAEAGWMRRYVVEPAVRPEAAGIVLVWDRPELPLEPAPVVADSGAEPGEPAAGAEDTLPAPAEGGMDR